MKTVQTLQRETMTETRISVGLVDGAAVVDLRVFFRNLKGGGFRATRNGIQFGVHLLPEIIAALQKAEAEGRSRGLIAGSGSGG